MESTELERAIEQSKREFEQFVENRNLSMHSSSIENSDIKNLLLHDDVTPWEPPPNFFAHNVVLRDHQKTGVSWMIEREREDALYTKGGILMDEAGLGKTLQTLTLIKATLDSENDSPTLIICPASLLQVWFNEIYQKFPLGSFRVYNYYGGARKQDDIRYVMENYNLILTSYGTVVSEWNQLTNDFIGKPSEGSDRKDFPHGSIFRKIMGRIILDEAHAIRNKSCLTSAAITQLLTKKAWCITATPIQNRIDDIFPLFSFMGIKPFEHNYEQWISSIVSPFQTNAILGRSNLNKYLIPITIRRTKDILNLPDITVHNHKIELSELEIDFYISLFYYSCERVKVIIKRMEEIKRVRKFQNKEETKGDKRLKRANSSVIILILRLRQACVNPSLVMRSMKRLEPIIFNPKRSRGFAEEKLESLPAEIEIKASIDRLNKLRIPNSMGDECPICMDEIASHVSSPCNHMCCRTCWENITTMTITARCPFCREMIESFALLDNRIDELENMDQVRENLKMEIEEIEKNMEESEEKLNNGVSSKINWILNHLATHDEKALIVSQWTQALNIVQAQFIQKFPGVKYSRLDGSIAPIRRSKIVNEFQHDKSDIRVCFVSQGASSEGITLTKATRVYILDCWWNETKDYQVYSRAHRMGQNKPVVVHRLIAKDTIEEKVSEMRMKKQKISEIMTGDSEDDIQDLSFINNVKLMFRIEEEDKLIKKRRINDVLPSL